jgi:ABC-type multidrug transport system fused ATPase/permease subunit
MNVATRVSDYRALYTPRGARRAAMLSALSALQRSLAPVLALELFRGGTLRDAVLAVALFVVVTVHSLAQRAYTTLTEAELCERIAARVLERHVLQPFLAPAEARVELSKAMYHAAHVAADTVPALVADVLASLVLTALLIGFEPPGVVVLGGLAALGASAVFRASHGLSERAVARAWEAQASAYVAFLDILEGRLEVVASGLRRAFVADLRRKTAAWAAEGASIAVWQALTGRLPLLAMAGVVGAAVLASNRAGATVTLRDVALFASVAPAYAGLAQGLQGLARNRRWVGIVARVLGAEPPARAGRAPSAPAPGALGFRAVSFRYDVDSSAAAVQSVDFEFEGPGALALAGPNGSGKTTCLRLLLALAAPSAGAVTIGGVALTDVDADAFRAGIAFVPQRPYFPPRCEVRKAIAWLAQGVPDSRMLDALDRVGLLASLQRMTSDPLSIGIDTLSAGQRQRVSLARMLCRDAWLYVLDEPDANLDRAGIALVAEIVGELARDRTVVLAAHTPELLRVARRVVTLDAGRVVRDQPAPSSGELRPELQSG